MEYQLKKEICPVCEAVFEGSSEQPVDLDLSLPDYCPDIERILKCRICPSVVGKSIAGDRLEIEGNALITLYYLDSKKQAIRSCEHNSPFSCSLKIKPDLKDPVSVVKLRTDYLNCRALSPRRVDIHGAFTVSTVVYAKTEQEICSGIVGDDIRQKTHTEHYSRLCGTGQQMFSITETLDIGQGKGMPESIIRSELSVRRESVKALSDKLMLNGEAVLRLLYVTDIETGSADTMTFNIPFTQVIDVQGISGDSVNDITLEVMSYDASLKSEYDENSTLVTLDARICATVMAVEDGETEIVDDAYSTMYESELITKQCRITRLPVMTEKDISVKSDVTTGENGITRITDIWCDTVSSIPAVENDSIIVKGKLLCCIFAADGDGVPFYAERPVEFSYSPEITGNVKDMNIKLNVQPLSLSFRITGDNTVEIKAELRICISAAESCVCRIVTSASYNEDKPRIKDKTAALTLYYADEGESLWSIARSYCTSVEAIKLENELEEDTVQSRNMLLIPM